MPYTQQVRIGWHHLDANRHMANVSYFELAVDLRIRYFADHGYPPAEFGRLHLGPVIQREEVEYFRELHLMDDVRLTLALAGLSSDGARFRLRNEFWKADGTLAARLTSQGGWLDLQARKLTPPPEPLAAALRAMPRTEDFAELPARRG